MILGHMMLGDVPIRRAYLGATMVLDTPAEDLTKLPVYDAFTDVPDGSNPTVAQSGQAWGIFSGPSQVTAGRWDSSDDTAAYLETDSGLQPVTRIGARWRFDDAGGTLTESGTMTLVTWADGGIVANGFGRRTSCHVAITQYIAQWYVRDTENGGNVTLVGTRALSKLPANTDLTADVRITEGVGTVEVYGQTLTWEDPRISTIDGERFTCWEPYYGGPDRTRVQIAEVWSDGTAPEPAEIGLTGAGYTRSETSALSDTVTVPATVQEGDLLLLVAQFISGSSTPLSAPAGWTEIGQHTRSAISAAIWARTATSGDIGQPVTVTSPTSKVHNLAVYGIAGVQSATLGASSDQSSGSTDFTMPTYTPTAGAIPAHILCVVSSTNPDPVAFTAPSGMATVSDNMPVSNDRQGILLGVADDWTPDAVVGDTWTADDTSHFGIKWAIELIPS